MFYQAGIHIKNRKDMFGKLLIKKPVSDELEVIKLEFLIFPYCLLGLGMVISIMAFVCEILHHRVKKRRTG